MKKSLVSIVDRPRFGLIEHSEALVSLANIEGFSSKTLSVLNERGVEGFALRKVFQLKNTTIVLWSLGITTIFIPILRLMGNRIICVIHEPGGFLQRIRKGDGVFYSFATSVYEVFQRFSHIRVTPNKNNTRSNLFYAPLLLRSIDNFSFKAEEENVEEKGRTIWYLGRFDNRRSSKLFQDLREKYSEEYIFRQFPSESLKTELDKVKALSNCLAIINLYTVPHNQSGVTLDAIRLCTPVLVTEHDFIADDIASNSLGCVISSQSLCIDVVVSNIRLLQARRKYFCQNSNYFSYHFGERAFQKFWKEIL